MAAESGAQGEGTAPDGRDDMDGRARWVRPIALVLAVAVAAVGIGAAWVFLAGEGAPSWLEGDAEPVPVEQELLGASGPHEAVLRSVRLAGYEEAAVGEDGGVVVVRLAAPYVATPAQVEFAWQIALASAAEAFPEADAYVAQLYSPDLSRDSALLEVEVEGDAVRGAVETGDPRSLREAATFTYLIDGAGRALPEAVAVLGDPSSADASAGTDEAGLDFRATAPYIDEKNHAAGLLDATGPAGVGALVETWETATSTVRPVPPADQDRSAVYLERTLGSLAAQDGVETAAGLEARVRDLAEVTAPGNASEPELKLWSEVAEAVATSAGGSLLADAAALTRTVLDAPVPEAGSAADAILAAAGSEDAPESARALDSFERVEALDATLTAGAGLVFEIEEASRAGLPVERYERFTGYVDELIPPHSTGGVPEVWPAYRSPSGRVFWRMGETGEYAITDGTTAGWAYTTVRAHVVEAADIFDVDHVMSVP
jgi:hypothetical protein